MEPGTDGRWDLLKGGLSQPRPPCGPPPGWGRGMPWYLGTPRAWTPWSASQFLRLPHSTGPLL